MVDADGCFVEWISPRIDCEGQRWKVILPEKPTTLTKAHSGQETKALQPSTTSTVHGRRFLFRSQKRLQTKFGRGRLCSCKPIGQSQLHKSNTHLFLTPLIYQQENIELLFILHPHDISGRCTHHRPKKLMVLHGMADQAKTRLSRAGSVFLAKLEING